MICSILISDFFFFLSFPRKTVFNVEENISAEKVNCFQSIASIPNWLASSFDSLIMFHAPSARPSDLRPRLRYFLYILCVSVCWFGLCIRFLACKNDTLHLINGMERSFVLRLTRIQAQYSKHSGNQISYFVLFLLMVLCVDRFS